MVLTPDSGLATPDFFLLLPDAVPDEVRHLDEEEAAVAAEARFEVAGERVDAVAIHVVVVAHVERGSGVRSPAE